MLVLERIVACDLSVVVYKLAVARYMLAALPTVSYLWVRRTRHTWGEVVVYRREPPALITKPFAWQVVRPVPVQM